MTRRRLALGAAGEERAAQWYLDRRYEVLARNWRCREGELDLVLEAPDGTLVFSEVKTRTTDRFGAPVEAVTEDKQRRIRRLATQYLRSVDEGSSEGPQRSRPRARSRATRGAIRFDVVSVSRDDIEVREGVF